MMVTAVRAPRNDEDPTLCAADRFSQCADEQQGLATGLVTMSQQVGIALGTPIMSAIATAWAVSPLVRGLQIAIGVDAAMAVITGLLVAVFLRPPRSQAHAEAQ